jgi:NAD(P)-dependent dehydrogenase (short-subunit alcohol dehydrogenase family)
VAVAWKCDVTNDNDIAALREQVEKLMTAESANVWALINNAGIGSGAAVDWCSMDVFRKIMEVNYFAVVNVTKHMLPLLKANRGSR